MKPPGALAAALVASWCTACPGPPDDTEPTPEPTPEPIVCPSGVDYGAISTPATAWVVDAAEGDDGAGGDCTAPLATLDEALARARDGGPRLIGVLPGEYTAAWDLQVGELAPFQDGDLAVEGWGSSDVTVTAADASAPIVRVTAATGMRFAGLTLVGGTRSLWLQGGAEADLEDLVLQGSTRAGIVIDGPKTLASGSDVTVEALVPEVVDGTTIGYGVVIDEGGADLTGLTVRDAAGVGVLVYGVGSGGPVTLDSLTVSDTAPVDGGQLGRGLHVQRFGSLAVTGDSRIEGSADAAVYAFRTQDLQLHDLEIVGVAAGTVPDGADSGDGLVVTSDDGIEDVPAANFVANLQGNTVSGFARGGILLETVTATLDGNTAIDDAGDPSLLAQGDPVLSGEDAVETLADPLDLNRLDLDDPALTAE